MKKGVAVFLMLLTRLAIFATEVAVAPILAIDRVGDKKAVSVRVQHDLVAEIERYNLGSALKVVTIHDSKINAPQSVKDATAVAHNEKAEYLLYGFVTQDEYTIQATLNLFDANAGVNVAAFYGSDDVQHYDRIMLDLAAKILSYFDESLHTFDFLDTEPEQMSRFSIPVAIGYWTPITSKWAKLVIGTGSVSAGVSLIPNDCLFISDGNIYYASVALDITYRYGIANPAIQTGSLNSFSFGFPILLHRRLNNKQGMFAGLGPIYSLEIFRHQEKYSEPVTHINNDFGMVLSIGYQYDMDNGLRLLFDSRIDVRFYNEAMISWSPRLGIDYAFMKEKVPKKWKSVLWRD